MFRKIPEIVFYYTIARNNSLPAQMCKMFSESLRTCSLSVKGPVNPVITIFCPEYVLRASMGDRS
jgi:hypothetical protein